MSTGIGDDDVERCVRLLRTLHEIDERLAGRLIQDPAAGIRVDGELGVLDPRVRRDAPGRVHVRLFIADEGEDELTRGLQLRRLEAQDRRHERNDACLVVRGAASVEVAVLLDELERIALPLFGTRIDDVHVCGEQNGPALLASGYPHDQRTVACIVERRDVRFRYAAGLQHLDQIRDHRRHLLLTGGRPKRNDSSVDLPGFHLVCRGLCGCWTREHGCHRSRQRNQLLHSSSR